ncbi:MAG: radical SAM family heme chaperone HemW [Lachnospira sp.]
MNPDVFGVYVHIPFCVHKCNYCDFLSFPGTGDAHREYAKAVLQEIEGLDEDRRQVASLFFGGGTPSVIDSSLIVSMVEALKNKFSFSKDAEITIECNPGTLTDEKASDYIRCGINRISFGLQSTDNKVLKMLGRIHTYEDFTQSLDIARRAGFTNISADIMSALPGQSVNDYVNTLNTVAELGLQHISAYSLIVEEDTHLYEHLKDYPPLPDEDAERNMYHVTEDILAGAGFYRYEISNYAKPGFESRHNKSYWELTDYIGLGLGASGFYKGKRYSNTSDFKTYIDGTAKGELSGIREVEESSVKDRIEEYMFLGLRKMEGVSYSEFLKIFGQDIHSIYADVISKGIKQGLLEEYNNPAEGGVYLKLTSYGIDVSNTVMSEFIID